MLKMYFDMSKTLAKANCADGKRYSKQEMAVLVDTYKNSTGLKKEEASTKIHMAAVPIIVKFCEQHYRTYFEKCPIELLHEGFTALETDLDNFNTNFEYTTFLEPRVKHAVQEYVNQMFNKTTAHYSSYSKKITRAINDKAKRNIPWTADDLSIELNIPISTVKQCLAIIHRNSSERSMDDADNMIAVKLSSRNPGPEDLVLDNMENEELLNTLKQILTRNELGVLIHTCGLFGEDTLSNKQTAEYMGIPEQEIKNLRATAQQKIERAFKNTHIFGKPFAKKAPVKKPVHNISFLKSKASLQNALDSFDLSAINF